MIESEAANDSERATIASVIYNRINAGMPLQIDATVMYALGEHKEYLTEEDLQVDSPYNTYLHTRPARRADKQPRPCEHKRRAQPPRTALTLYYALNTETGEHEFFTNYLRLRGLYGDARTIPGSETQ